jgi:SAM-dependent methyltransferase
MKSVEDKVYANAGNPEVLSWVPAHCRTVLDVGCGAGDNARILADRGCIVDGLTLSPEEAVLAESVCRKVYVCNLEAGLPADLPQQYDAVICSHVLEHICFPSKLLTDIRERLTDDGCLIVALPNLLWWKNRLRLLTGNFRYTEAGIMDRTHFRWYTFETGRELFEEHGFSRVTAEVDGEFPCGPIRRCFPKPMQRRMDAWATKHWPGLFGYQLLYTVRR